MIKFDYFEYCRELEEKKKEKEKKLSLLSNLLSHYCCPICREFSLYRGESTSYGHGESYYMWWIECRKCGYRTRGYGSYTDCDEVGTMTKCVDNLIYHHDCIQLRYIPRNTD